MLRPVESKFYQWLARTQTDDRGAVVDLGAFIGGSSARLAHGLSQTTHTAGLHVFDRFRTTEALKKRILYPGGVRPFAGSSILPHARDFLKPWQDRLTLHPGQIEDVGWNGGPIQLLCVDAFKRVDATDIMVADFFPYLIPGRSIVVHQDFLQPAQPWLVALMWALRDVFEPMAVVNPSTIAFRCVRRIAASDVRRARLSGLSDGDMLQAIARTKAAFRGWGIGHKLDRIALAVEASPDCRVAHQMVQPSRAAQAA